MKYIIQDIYNNKDIKLVKSKKAVSIYLGISRNKLTGEYPKVIKDKFIFEVEEEGMSSRGNGGGFTAK